MQNKPKVLHYIGTFSHLAETFIYDLITNLHRSNTVDQFVLCHQRINENNRPFEPLQTVPFERSLIEKIKRRVFSRKYSSRQLSTIANIFESEKPDLIHAHFGINGISAFDFLNKLKINTPMLVHCHGTDVLSLPFTQPRYKKKLLSLVERPKTRFITNTQFLKQSMIDLGIPENLIHIVHHSVNPSFMATSRKYEGYLDPTGIRPMRIIAIGRMIRWKGHRYLLEGLAQFLDKYPGSAKLTLIGDGKERANLEALSRKLKIEDAISFRGAVPHTEVALELKEHDLLIQPSFIDPETRQCESFGMTILEAIASGLPVAVSRSGGMPELVGAETPWSRIFEPASAEAIAETIAACYIEKPHLTSNAEYSQQRLNFFSWENQKSALLETYRNMIGNWDLS